MTIRSGAVSPNSSRGPAAPPGGAADHAAPSGGTRLAPEERRFGFGKNWRRFLSVIDEDRIQRACDSLTRLTERESLSGLSFLDIGCGSGLLSLAALRLGARVHSFDCDPDSVACAVALRARYGARDGDWTIERGSALDQPYMRSLGHFDIVYAWGVLHHTGDLRRAMENAALPVGEGGILIVAVYNDQGRASRRWRTVKKLYVRGALGRAVVLSVFVPYFAAREIGGALLHRRGLRSKLSSYRADRGMSLIHDWVDWLGGYPFEVARPEEVVHLYRGLGFVLTQQDTCAGLGNNQFVLVRRSS